MSQLNGRSPVVRLNIAMALHVEAFAKALRDSRFYTQPMEKIDVNYARRILQLLHSMPELRER